MYRRYRFLVFLIAASIGWSSGCEQDCPTPDPGDAGADGDADGDAGNDGGERECVIPEEECDDGEHAEYGECVSDDEEVTISAGSFEMGAPTGDDFPLHDVTVDEFRIDRYEVTNQRFAACVDAGCCDPPTYDGSYSGREPYYGNSMFRRCPVIFVTWEQARQYCEGIGKRLPTEAEWEHAARGDAGRPFPWGNESPTSSRANFDRAISGDTMEVGRREDGGTPEGVQDMAGNVWEWVADWYSTTYYDESPSDNPQGPDSGVSRVARGGSFGSSSTELYTFYRMGFHPSESFSNVGFRCAR